MRKSWRGSVWVWGTCHIHMPIPRGSPEHRSRGPGRTVRTLPKRGSEHELRPDRYLPRMPLEHRIWTLPCRCHGASAASAATRVRAPPLSLWLLLRRDEEGPSQFRCRLRARGWVALGGRRLLPSEKQPKWQHYCWGRPATRNHGIGDLARWAGGPRRRDWPAAYLVQ